VIQLVRVDKKTKQREAVLWIFGHAPLAGVVQQPASGVITARCTLGAIEYGTTGKSAGGRMVFLGELCTPVVRRSI
jgi:hypothetical protein